MTEEKKKRKPLGLQSSPDAQIPKEQIRQSLSHGRSNTVTVEIKRRRDRVSEESITQEAPSKLTNQEQSLRLRAVQEAIAEQEKFVPEIPEEEIIEPTIAIEEDDLYVEQALSIPIQEIIAPKLTELSKKRNNTREEREDPIKEEIRKIPKTVKKKNSKIAVEDERDSEILKKPIIGLKKLRNTNKERSIFSSAKQQPVHIEESVSVVHFGVSLSQKTSVILKQLSKLGVQATMDFIIDPDTAQMIAEDLGYTVIRHSIINKEDELWNKLGTALKERPPVVTVMGHVDHGKTSLLDALRKTDVAGKEFGGITQHIGAYQIRLASGKMITFIDTPGHEAFTQMRARGSHVTDIVILVVAADEGVSAQTVEAIRHAQASKVPIIVAINKIDKPNAKPDNVRQALLSYNMVVEKLGGDIQDVEVSAIARTNLDGLEEAILLQGEILNLQADETMRAKGTVLETHMKKGHGAVATVLIQDGTLSKGDIFVVGETYGKVRLLFDDKGQIVKKALPSQPIEIVGFNDLPQSGDRLIVVPDEFAVKEFIAWKKAQRIETILPIFQPKIDIQELTLIVKTDTQGALEGITHELAKIQHTEVELKIIHQAIGAVNESDALLAQATGAVIVAFNVPVLPEARKIIEQKGVLMLHHRIIYQAIDDIRKALSGLLSPIYQEEDIGKAEVIQIFHHKKTASVAGCMIKSGILRRGECVRILRNGKICHDGFIKSLRRIKDDVREIASGYECGVMIEGYEDFQIGDVFECFTKKAIQRSV